MSQGKLAVFAAAVMLVWCGCAAAQDYGDVQADPCAPQRNIFGGYMPPSAQQRQACIDLRNHQWSDYRAHQKAEQDARDAQSARDSAEEARREAEQAAAEAKRLAAARQDARMAGERRRAAYFAQVAAERSVDNHCRVPEIARSLMEAWNDFDQFKELGVRVVDIEHLTTTRFDPAAGELACHGLFKTTKGLDLLGTLATKKNVAGDPIYSWHLDDSQDVSIYDAPPLEEVVASPQSMMGASPPADAGDPKAPASFVLGLDDRRHWESWLAGLSGDEKDGATWWAVHRNSPNHVGCEAAAEKDDSAWEAGCLNAQRMLTAVDAKRRSDGVYKKGWNSF